MQKTNMRLVQVSGMRGGRLGFWKMLKAGFFVRASAFCLFLAGAVPVEADTVIAFSDDFAGASGLLSSRVTPVGGLQWIDQFNRSVLANNRIEVSQNNQFARVQTNGLDQIGLNQVLILEADFLLNGADLSGSIGGATISMYDNLGSPVAPTGDALSFRLIGSGTDAGKFSLFAKNNNVSVADGTKTTGVLSGYDTDLIHMMLKFDRVNLQVVGIASNTVTGDTVSHQLSLTQAEADALVLTHYGESTTGYLSGTAVWDNLSASVVTTPPADGIAISDDFDGASGLLSSRVTPVGGLLWIDQFNRSVLASNRIEVSVNNQMARVHTNGLDQIGTNQILVLEADFLVNGADLTGAYGGPTICMYDNLGAPVVPTGDALSFRMVTVPGESLGTCSLFAQSDNTQVADGKKTTGVLAGYDTDLIHMTLQFDRVNLQVVGIASNTVTGDAVSQQLSLTQAEADALVLTHYGFSTTGYASGTALWDNFSVEVVNTQVQPGRYISLEIIGANAVVTFDGATGLDYVLQWKQDLVSGESWSNVVSGIAGAGGMQSVSNALSTGTSFYRVVSE